jgi:hypothetical protein
VRREGFGRGEELRRRHRRRVVVVGSQSASEVLRDAQSR